MTFGARPDSNPIAVSSLFAYNITLLVSKVVILCVNKIWLLNFLCSRISLLTGT
jgi:hypothetical protein